jgi:hypothetical protein
VCSNANETAAGILKRAAYRPTTTKAKARGRVVDNQENLAVIEQPAMPVFYEKILDRKGFSTEDVLWAVGIWSVLLTMTPVIFFYMLMVA